MTLSAANAFRDVNVVTEEHVVRQNRDPIPVQRFVVGEARPDRCKHRCARPDLRMASHAGMRRG